MKGVTLLGPCMMSEGMSGLLSASTWATLLVESAATAKRGPSVWVTNTLTACLKRLGLRTQSLSDMKHARILAAVLAMHDNGNAGLPYSKPDYAYCMAQCKLRMLECCKQPRLLSSLFRKSSVGVPSLAYVWQLG